MEKRMAHQEEKEEPGPGFEIFMATGFDSCDNVHEAR